MKTKVKQRGQFAHNPNIGDTCDCLDCQPTEKPMDWEKRLKTYIYTFAHNIEYDLAHKIDWEKEAKYRIKQIKDLLKEESEAYEDTIQILKEPDTLVKIWETKIRMARVEALAEYKQKLLKRIRKMKRYLPEPSSSLRIQLRFGRKYFNQALDEVEAVIRED